MKSKVLLAILILFVGPMVTMFDFEATEAAPSAPLRRGYFTNASGPSNLSLGTVLNNGLMNGNYPTGSTSRDTVMDPARHAFTLTNKAQFISFFKGKLSGSVKDQVGASFIINNILGEQGLGFGGSPNRPPTASEIQDWENYMNRGDVSLVIDEWAVEAFNSAFMVATSENETTYTSCDTSPFPAGPSDGVCAPPSPGGSWSPSGAAYVNGFFTWSRRWVRTVNYAAVDDDMFFSNNTTLPSLNVVQGGVPIVRIKINCANIIGSPNPPTNPPASWLYDIDVTDEGDQSPGDTFDIASRLENNTTTNGTVATGSHGHRLTPYQGASYITRVTGGNTSTNATDALWTNFGPILAGTGVTRTASWRVNANAPDGAQVCFRALASPKSGLSDNTNIDWGGYPPAAGSTALADTTCFNIDNPRWNYQPSINPITDKKPGESFNVSSSVTNDDAGQGLNYWHRIESRWGEQHISMNSPADAGSKDGLWNNQAGLAGFATGPTRTANYTVNSGVDHGETICFSGRTNPSTGNGPTVTLGERASPWECFDVYNLRFNLDVAVSGPTNAQPGEAITVDYNVCNSGVLPAGAARGIAPSVGIGINGAIGSNQNTTTDVSSDPNNCWQQTRNFTVPATYNVGDTLCTTITTNKDTGYSDNTDLAGSNTEQHCLTVGVTPYFHVLNGDVWAGAIFDTQIGQPRQTCGTSPDAIIRSVTSTLSGAPLGSFVERAAFATGVVSGFGSDGAPNLMNLIFANDPSLGEYTNDTKCIPNYFGLLNDHNYPAGTDVTSNSRNLASFTADNEQFRVRPGSGTFTLTGNANNYSKNQTIVVDGNLVISNDINFNTVYGSSGSLDVPSLIFVVSGDILIDQSVGNVDAILISHGDIWTCSNGSTPTTAVAENVCDEQLTINGALIANRINFMRTREGGGNKGGVHDASSEPAEVINFLPEFYLSSPVFKSNYLSENAFETLLIRDLPPIY